MMASFNFSQLNSVIGTRRLPVAYTVLVSVMHRGSGERKM